MYKPKAGDRVEFVGANWYRGILRAGERGTVVFIGGEFVVLWDKQQFGFAPHWSLCRLIERDGPLSLMEQWREEFWELYEANAGDDLHDDLAEVVHRLHVELFPEVKDGVCHKCRCEDIELRYCDGASQICFAIHRYNGEHMHHT